MNVTEKQPAHNPWLMLLKSRRLVIRFLACCWCWVAVAFVYYGLTINSVNNYFNIEVGKTFEAMKALEVRV